MAETSEQIRRDLERTRARVGGTIAALERKVNPRYVLDDHPVAVVGAAFGVGVLLGATGAAQKAAVGAAHEVREQLRSGTERASKGTSNVVDGIVQTILSTATAAITAKLTAAMSNVLPSSHTSHTSHTSQASRSSQASGQASTHAYLGTGGHQDASGADGTTRSDFRAA